MANNDINTPLVEINTVYKFLQRKNLAIPSYQRPYKWTQEHTEKLWTDIQENLPNEGMYRLGTIVLHHDEKDVLNIVDGQQRTLTLVLLIKALLSLKIDKQNNLLSGLANTGYFTPTFSQSTHQITKTNLYNNYASLSRLLKQNTNTDELVHFILCRCEFVVVTLHNISEAFQFFDSQNSRGKDLNPHDLLKAYHLRQFNKSETEDVKNTTIAAWEAIEDDKLATLFSDYLFNIRRWCRGMDAKKFTKDDIDIFKGISAECEYPLARVWQLAYEKIACEQKDNEEKDNGLYQLDQPLINGRYFFKWVSHYNENMKFHEDALEALKERLEDFNKPKSSAKDILDELGRYRGRYRSGDKYVFNLFSCLLMLYIDKFANTRLDEAIEKSFIWSYLVRLDNKRLTLNSINNYVRKKSHFMTIQYAVAPNDFLNQKFKYHKDKDKEYAAGLEKIRTLFNDMRYINGGTK